MYSNFILLHFRRHIMSHISNVAQADAFPWQTADTLPDDVFSLTRITHFENPRREKLVFAKAQEDGILLADGSNLNFDWSVTGWVSQDIEVDLRPAAASQAQIAELDWQTVGLNHWFASDGLGGEYSYHESKKTVRFEAGARSIFFTSNDPRKTAQEHHNSRIKNRLTD
jgi:hypothetical protein